MSLQIKAPQLAEGSKTASAEDGVSQIGGPGTKLSMPQNMFGDVHGSGSRAWWLTVSGLVTMSLAGGGFYYYLDSLHQPTLVAAQPTSTKLAQEPMTSIVAANRQPRPTAGLIAEPIPQQAPATAAIAASPNVEAEHPTAIPERLADSAAMAGATPPPGKVQPAKTEDGLARDARNRISTTTSDTAAMPAYQAFMAGDDMTAERLYREALRSEPRNVDVLLGLAAVAARQGRVEEAQQHYMHVLDLEPRSAAAYAGLIGLVGQTDPAGSASRLKSLLAQQPDAAFLHEALGNLYAEQGQWPTAQQSYSQAYLLDPSSAEYAFNLAVSLDQLNETKLALSYYQRAQELQSSRAGALDKDQLETRISQLRQSLNQ